MFCYFGKEVFRPISAFPSPSERHQDQGEWAERKEETSHVLTTPVQRVLDLSDYFIDNENDVTLRSSFAYSVQRSDSFISDVEETKSLEVTSQTSGDTHLKNVMSPLTNSREHLVSVFVINKLS